MLRGQWQSRSHPFSDGDAARDPYPRAEFGEARQNRLHGPEARWAAADAQVEADVEQLRGAALALLQQLLQGRVHVGRELPRLREAVGWKNFMSLVSSA